MDELKFRIAETIFLPDYLINWNERQEVKDFIYSTVFEILNIYYSGVKSELLSERLVKRYCRRIDKLNDEAYEYMTPNINLQNWLWIGSTIESWIDFSLELEEYEAAANLRKLLNKEYA